MSDRASGAGTSGTPSAQNTGPADAAAPGGADVPRPDPALRQAAVATAAVFALSGFLLSGWLVRLPATRDRLHVDSGSLGLALLMTGLGSLTLMPATGWLCARFGSRSVVLAGSCVACAAFVSLAFAPSVWWLGALLFVLGAAYGSWDVAMNVQGSHVDQLTGRDLMPRYHGSWSVGSILGAGAGALAAKVGMSLPVHFSLAAAVVVAGVLTALGWFVPDRRPGTAPATPTSAGPRPRPARLLTLTLVLIGLVTLCGTCIEGGAGDWLALYLTDGRGLDPATAASGYAVFAVAMASSRFAGTSLIDRIGRVGAVRLGGVVAGVGILGTVTLPGTAGALFGALLWGLGVAVVFPAAMSAGGELPGRGSDGIAAVSTIGYAGFLLGPPLIGLLGRHVGLGPALLVLLVLAAGIVLLSPAVRSGRLDGQASAAASRRTQGDD